jgi:hypothetical protein
MRKLLAVLVVAAISGTAQAAVLWGIQPYVPPEGFADLDNAIFFPPDTDLPLLVNYDSVNTLAELETYQYTFSVLYTVPSDDPSADPFMVLQTSWDVPDIGPWPQFDNGYFSMKTGADIPTTRILPTSPVPIPIAAFLYGSALLGLVAVKRRRKYE